MIRYLWMLLLLSSARSVCGFSLGCWQRIPRYAHRLYQPIRYSSTCSCHAAKDHEDETDGVSWLVSKDGAYRLAYHRVPTSNNNAQPAVLFCNGFRSAMTGGTKVVALQEHCRERGWEICAFDYRGHGLSSGVVEDCTLSDWIRDASKMLDFLVGNQNKRVVLVGSSMGAWIAIHLALKYNNQNFKDGPIIAGILGIASAPDFLQDLFASSTEEQQAEWRTRGILKLPSRYGDPYPIPWNLVKDAEQHWGILPTTQSVSLTRESSGATNQLSVCCPVRLLHGKCDEDISWTKSKQLLDLLNESEGNDDTILTLIEDGDHRLSRPQDIELLLDTLDDMMENLRG